MLNMQEHIRLKQRRSGCSRILVVIILVCICNPNTYNVQAVVKTPSVSRARLVQPGRPSIQNNMKKISSSDEGLVPRLKRPLLELITPDGCASSSELPELISRVECAISGGVSLVQLRDYESSPQSKDQVAKRLRSATRGKAFLVVNNDISIARSCGADGVHLPERMIGMLEGLRGTHPWLKIIGCSVHSIEAAVRASKLGADYIQVGTMFATRSHPGKEPDGVLLLREVRQRLQVEGLTDTLILGVGGIDASNCGSVAESGADGVAVIRCLCETSDAEGEARRMVGSLRRHIPAIFQ